MQVNHKKTQMLCISASKNKCHSHIITSERHEITSAGNLKILGYVFDDRPSPGAHVGEIERKVRRRH